MDTETAMIISTVMAVGASLLTLLITRIFDTRLNKRKERERFFYEIYKRRLALYRKILKQSSLFYDVTPFISLSELSHDDAIKIGKIAASFIGLSDTSALVASPAVADALKLIGDFINKDVIAGKRLKSTRDFEVFVIFMTERLALLNDLIRKETCPAFVDEYLFELTKT